MLGVFGIGVRGVWHWGVRGVWQYQNYALFDIRVVDSDAPSYLDKTPQLVLSTAERNKKSKYNQACESRHASFTPLCITVDGMLGTEFKSFLKRLGDSLSVKWDKSYSATMYWIKCKLSFAVIRATNLCLRGSRTKWRGIEMEDGSGINPFLPGH